MSRVHIGEKNGRMGFWISAPGHDASSEDKMILSSDYDYLKIHARGHIVLKADFYDDVNGVWVYSGKTEFFPTLPYYPFYWVAVAFHGGRFFYPMRPIVESYRGNKYIGVRRDRIIVDDVEFHQSDGADVHVYYQIFKNKLADA